jgi:hypothetical protein
MLQLKILTHSLKEAMMSLKYVLAAGLTLPFLCACTTPDINTSVVKLQSATAQMLGLASSDELTVSKVNTSEPDALGGQKLTYTARTRGGRVFDCSAMMMPGLLISPPSISNPTCKPIQVHK